MIDSNKLILLVEDNRNDELLAIRALKKSSVNSDISIARDGVEALSFLFKQQDGEEVVTEELPELILLDLNLPKLSGLEVLKKLKQHKSTSQIPIVVMTSSNEDEDISSSYKFGANSYIRKPIDFQDFSLLINNLATYWLELNQTPNTTRH